MRRQRHVRETLLPTQRLEHPDGELKATQEGGTRGEYGGESVRRQHGCVSI